MIDIRKKAWSVTLKGYALNKTKYELVALMLLLLLAIYLVTVTELINFREYTIPLQSCYLTIDDIGIWVHTGEHPYKGSMIAVDPNRWSDDDIEIKKNYFFGIYYCWIRLGSYSETNISVRWWLIASIVVVIVTLICFLRVRERKEVGKKGSTLLGARQETGPEVDLTV